MNKTCEVCLYYQKDEIPNRKGECRLNPPVPVPREGNIITTWPVTKKDDWCGQFVSDQVEVH